MMNETKKIVYKSKFRQLFCKHEYETGVLEGPFYNIAGEKITTICTKCGKVKSEYFREYEGMGFK